MAKMRGGAASGDFNPSLTIQAAEFAQSLPHPAGAGAGEATMPISDISSLSALRTRMHWAQERQRLLAENVANADTPGFRPRDLAPLSQSADAAPSAMLAMATTNPAHVSGSDGAHAAFALSRGQKFETRPTGNAVNLQDEMVKVAANQMDYQAAASLYSRSLALLKTAIGKR